MAMQSSNKSGSFESAATAPFRLKTNKTFRFYERKMGVLVKETDTELWLTEQDLLGLNKYPHLECRAQNLLVEKD